MSNPTASHAIPGTPRRRDWPHPKIGARPPPIYPPKVFCPRPRPPRRGCQVARLLAALGRLHLAARPPRGARAPVAPAPPAGAVAAEDAAPDSLARVRGRAVMLGATLQALLPEDLTPLGVPPAQRGHVLAQVCTPRPGSTKGGG